MPIDINMPGEDPIQTREKVNDLINRGFRFTALVEGQRVPIRAIGLPGAGDDLNVVVGQIHENRWAITDACTIQPDSGRKMRV